MKGTARFRQMPTTTTMTVQPNGKPRISARNVVAQRQQRLSAQDAKDPTNVARTITFLQENIAKATESLRNEPMVGSIVFQGITVSAGVTFLLTHNFGRAASDYIVTRTYFGVGTGITLGDAALPAGVSNLTTIALVPSGSGKINVRVW